MTGGIFANARTGAWRKLGALALAFVFRKRSLVTISAGSVDHSGGAEFGLESGDDVEGRDPPHERLRDVVANGGNDQRHSGRVG